MMEAITQVFVSSAAALEALPPLERWLAFGQLSFGLVALGALQLLRRGPRVEEPAGSGSGVEYDQAA